MMRSDGEVLAIRPHAEIIRTGEGAALLCALVDETASERILADMARNAVALEQARDEADAANSAKTKFLATISHEIRTPLNGILGMAQAMSVDPLPKIQKERLSVVRQSGEALLAILNDILDLSKIEAGKLELEIVDFDLGELLNGVWVSTSAAAEAKGLTTALSVEQEAPGLYRGDPTRIRQILYNFVSNALKFTEQGGIEIRASRPADGTLEIAVADTGIGLTPEQLSQLFERFNQVDTSRARTHGGTGLGLAICRELANMMAGEVSVISEAGRGSTITLVRPQGRIGEPRALHSFPTRRSSDLQKRIEVGPHRRDRLVDPGMLGAGIVGQHARRHQREAMHMDRPQRDAGRQAPALEMAGQGCIDRESTRLNSSHITISYAVFCL